MVSQAMFDISIFQHGSEAVRTIVYIIWCCFLRIQVSWKVWEKKKLKKLAILTRKPWIRVSILIYWKRPNSWFSLDVIAALLDDIYLRHPTWPLGLRHLDLSGLRPSMGPVEISLMDCTIDSTLSLASVYKKVREKTNWYAPRLENVKIRKKNQ